MEKIKIDRELNLFDKVMSLINKNAIYFVFILLCIVMGLLREAFFSLGNIINVLRQVSVTGIISLGMTMIIISGGIDLSPGSVVAFASIVATMLALPGGPPLIVSIVGGMCAGAVCGLWNGVVIAFARIPPFIATLGMMSIARGCALLLSKGRSIMDMRPSYLAMGRGSLGIVPIPVIIFVSLCIISHIILRKSKLGRHIYGIGGNEQAAVVCGINIKRVKMIVYTYAGVMVGFASIIMSARATVGAPAAGVGYEFDAITAVVLGGTSLSGGVGMIPKTVIGVLIIGVLNNGLTILGVSPYFQLVFKGLLITGAVILDTLRYREQ